MKRIFPGVIALVLGIVAARAADPVGLPRVPLGEAGIPLQDWLLIGSFEAAGGEAAIDMDFLNGLGATESVGRSEDLLKLAAQLPAVASRPSISAKYVTGAPRVNLGALYKGGPVPDVSPPQTAAYAACEIVSQGDREAWLLLGSDDGAKVWLNGELRHVSRDRSLTAYGAAIRLTLHRGSNLLLVKVANIAMRWAMHARLEPDMASATRTTLDASETLLERALIPSGQPLQLIKAGIPDSFLTEVEIENAADSSVKHVRLGPAHSLEVSGWPRGLYHLTLKLNGKRYRQNFYLGDMAELGAEITKRCQEVTVDDQTSINLQAQLRLIGVYQKPYQAKLRYQSDTKSDALELEAALARAEKITVDLVARTRVELDRVARGEKAFPPLPGLHIRGFRSRIDDQVMHYRLCVPSNYKPADGKLALIIFMATVFERKGPFLNSVLAGKQEEAERLSEIAEKLGVGILWPGYRTCPYGNPGEFSYLDEVLRAVDADYHLDPSRLYLYGDCSSGMTASMEAVLHPRRYAAMACLDPVMHRVKNRFDDDGRYDQLTAYKTWLQATDPVRPLASLRDLPIWIIHQGVDPGHGPLAHAVDFVTEARAVGNHPRFDRVRGERLTKLSLYERQFSWLAQQRRNGPAPLDFAVTQGGPLSRAFAERFIVVEATEGGDAEKAANQALSLAFQKAWQDTNYVGCRVIKDRELTAEEERQSNLVLIGNAQTNQVWQRLAAQLPVAFAANGITINGHSYQGRALGLQAWFPHPRQPGRKVVLLGGYELGKMAFGTLELALDGWFDYAIWNNGADGPQLMAAEHYPAAGSSRKTVGFGPFVR